MMKKYFFALVLIIGGCLQVFSQEMEVLDTRVPEHIKFAQPFTLQMYISHPQDAVISTDETAFPKEFEVTNVSAEKKSPTATLYRITAIPFTIKQSTFTAAFSLDNGTKKPVKLVKSVPLKVEKVAVFKDSKFRDIRTGKKPINWGLWLFLLLVTALIIGSVIYANRAKLAAKKIADTGVPDNRPPNIIALSQIDALVKSGLWERHQYKLFYLTMSDIFREYLWRMFGLDVSADTSAELLRRLKPLPQFAPLLNELRNLLNSGDLVKFARFVPSEQIRNKDILLLVNMIKKTTPAPTTQTQEKPL